MAEYRRKQHLDFTDAHLKSVEKQLVQCIEMSNETQVAISASCAGRYKQTLVASHEAHLRSFITYLQQVQASQAHSLHWSSSTTPWCAETSVVGNWPLRPHSDVRSTTIIALITLYGASIGASCYLVLQLTRPL